MSEWLNEFGEYSSFTFVNSGGSGVVFVVLTDLTQYRKVPGVNIY